MEWIYDRTQEDVDRVIELNSKYINGTISEDEKIEWSGGMKGALNASDLNRIEENTAIIAELVATVVFTKSWISSDIPRKSDYERIRDNVQKVRDAWFVLSNTPNTPMHPLNTYKKWNEIEQILHDMYYIYERQQNNYYYCGTEIYAGEGNGDI